MATTKPKRRRMKRSGVKPKSTKTSVKTLVAKSSTRSDVKSKSTKKPVKKSAKKPAVRGPLSDKHKAKISAALLGKEPWNKGQQTGVKPWNKGLTKAKAKKVKKS